MTHFFVSESEGSRIFLCRWNARMIARSFGYIKLFWVYPSKYNLQWHILKCLSRNDISSLINQITSFINILFLRVIMIVFFQLFSLILFSKTSDIINVLRVCTLIYKYLKKFMLIISVFGNICTIPKKMCCYYIYYYAYPRTSNMLD